MSAEQTPQPDPEKSQSPPFDYDDPLAEVKDAQDELEQDKRRNEARQAALKLLDQASKDREQARGAYEKAEEQLTDDHEDLGNKADAILRDAKKAVGETAAARIGDIVLGYLGKIPAARATLQTLKGEARTLSTEYRQKVWAREDLQEMFGEVKNTPKDKSDSIKAAKDLLARAEKEEKGDDPRIYYYLAKRLAVQVSDVAIDPLVIVAKELKEAFDSLAAAVKAERDALIKLEEKKVEIERAKKELDEWEKQHDERILPKVRAVDQSAGEPSPSGGAVVQVEEPAVTAAQHRNPASRPPTSPQSKQVTANHDRRAPEAALQLSVPSERLEHALT